MDLPLLKEAIAKLNEHATTRLSSTAREPADFPPAARAAVALGNDEAVSSLTSALRNKADRLVSDLNLSPAEFAHLVDAAVILQSYSAEVPLEPGD
jgi:hypothetical protein